MIPPDRSVHFDLGVDRLADGSEIANPHDPWTPTHEQLPDPRAPHGIPLPPEDLEPWAARLQLPGL